MERLVSIEEVEKKYSTGGSHPLLVHANDLEHYICKYPFFTADHKLLNEFLGYHFARLWDIRIPEMKLVNLKREHVPENLLGMGLTYRGIQNALVGSQQLTDVTEIVDNLSEGISDSELRKYNRKEFLKIALFDIWLSNDDRNTGNMNLLIGMNETSKLYHRLFKSRKKYLSIIEEISSSLHDYQARCFENLKEIVDSIPEEWGYDSDEIFESLKQGIFSEEWLTSVKRTFHEFTSQMTQRL